MALTEKKFLTDEEFSCLLRLCDRHRTTRDSILIRFILFTGARSCEALAVTRDSLGKGCVALKGAKGSNDRTIPLPPKFYKELIDYVDRVEGERLFPISTRMLRYIWRDYRPNFDKGVHCLRHTFGVRLYMNCEDIHAVKTALGHKSIINTQIYVDFVENVKTMRTKLNGMWDLKVA